MLRSAISTLALFAFVGAIGVLGQEPQEPKEQPKQAPPATTLTGCVQEAKTTDGGTAYVLNKVEGGKAPMYVLVGPPPSEFASHVNHKIEVTGQVQEPAMPPAEEQPEKEKKVLRPPLVQVESVKMVADTCGG
jgi:hypothetical protein